MKHLTKVFSIIITLSIMFLFTNCAKEDSRLKNETLSATNFAELVEKIKNDKAFSREDIDLFSSAIVRLGTSFDSLNGKSVAQLIDNQKEFLRSSSNISLINSALSIIHGFGYLGWQPLEQNNQKFFVFGFALQNKTKQDIKKVEGILKFVTANNQMVKGFRISLTQDLKAAVTQQFTSTFVMDQNNKNDLLLNDLLTSKNPNIFPLWQCNLVEFADGKKIALPQ